MKTMIMNRMKEKILCLGRILNLRELLVRIQVPRINDLCEEITYCFCLFTYLIDQMIVIIFLLL
jgi:hypothetical protein